MFGVDRHGAPEMDCGLSLGLGERLRCMEGDMADSARIREIVAKSLPTWIVHLAARPSFPPPSRTPWEPW